MLLGCDPRTGVQLVSAVGSAGRTGNNPTADVDGSPDELMSLTDAANAIGVYRTYLWRLAKKTAESHQPGPPTDSSTPPTGRRSGTYLLAEKVNGRWMVSRGEVARFVAARSQPQVVMAYDVTFSAPKSLSIVWATADAATRRLCEEAFEAGVARGVEYLERNAVWVRRGRGHEPASGMIAASYRHSTNREFEPQLHEHVVIANMATGGDGRVQALDGRGLFLHATTAGHIAEAEMQHACNRAGIRWTPIRRGIADIEGVGREAIRAMSTRREQILSLTTELGTDSARARQTAAVVTRAAKDTSVDPLELRRRWLQRLSEAGFGPEQLAAAISAEPARLWTPDESRRMDRHLAGPAGVTEQQAVFDRRDVIQAIVDFSGGRLSGYEVIEHAERWLHTEAVIPLETEHPLDSGGRVVEQRYTTPSMIRIEGAITAGYQAGHDTGAAAVPGDIIDSEIARWEVATGSRFGEDQRAMVHAICSSGDRFQAVVGPAGSGKTAALEVAARAWEHSGYKVIGAAVNGTAAEILDRATGVESRTVAGLVTRLDTATDRVLDDRTVLLVDEASTLGNRPHARLVAHVQAAGGAMRAIGDPAQHGAVDAGGMWAQMVDAHPERTPRLVENRRQAGTEMADVRLANADYRAGRIAEAIDRLDANDRIVTAATSSELLDQVAVDWYVDHKAHPESSSRMIAEHHRERRALNVRAQALLRSDGTIDGSGVEIGESLFHVGDQVIARTPNRNLHPPGDAKAYVRNGTPGTVTAIEGQPGFEHLVVDFENRGPITVPTDWIEAEIRPGVIGGLAPAYAVTSHAAQGDTYRSGRMVATDTAKTEAVYVGLTRGSHDTRIYTVAAEPKTADTDPQMPRIEERRDEIEVLRDQLAKPPEVETASAVAPDAAEVMGLLDRPLAELESSTDAAAQHAVRIVTARICQQARADPDPALIERIGQRSDHNDPQVWDGAVEARALAAHRPPDAGADETAVLVRSAEVSRLERVSTESLAERRCELVAQARRIPGHSPRLAKQDLAKAEAAVTTATDTYDAALVAHSAADRRRGRRRDPDSVEEARRDLETASHELSNAQRQYDTARMRLGEAERGTASMADLTHRVDVIDDALAPRIQAAVDEPADYLIDTLGPRPDTGARSWDRAARGIETYRHATLGITPDHGPVDPSAKHPAIGAPPTDPIGAEVWPGVARLISISGHSREIEPLGISQ